MTDEKEIPETIKLNNGTYILLFITVLSFTILEILQLVFFLIGYDYGYNTIMYFYGGFQIWFIFTFIIVSIVTFGFTMDYLLSDNPDVENPKNIIPSAIIVFLNFFYFPMGLYNLYLWGPED